MKTTDNVLHIIITLKLLIINLNYLFVVRNIRLVKQAKNLLQAIVNSTMQQRNLHNDAIMLQTLYKRIRNTLLYFFAIIIISMMVDIYNRLLYLTDTMPQKIDSYHRNCILLMLFLQHILLIVILQCKITTETQSLSWQPGFLKFNQHQVRLVVFIQYSSSKVDTKHRDRLTTGQIRIFISANLHIYNFLLQQCRKNGLRYAIILHQVFEHSIIKRVCYIYNHNISSNLISSTLPQNYTYSSKPPRKTE